MNGRMIEMSGQRRADKLQYRLIALIALMFFFSFAVSAAADSVEAARAAADAEAAAREGAGIPALSEGQTEAYMDGRAMWMAIVAELNHYPGPRRVLELEDRLKLTAEQRQAVIGLYDDSRREAVRYGKQLIELEQKLNRMFAWGQASVENIVKIVTDIGAIQARLRLTHLVAHIRTKELLTMGQVKRYDEIQGYTLSTGSNGDKTGCGSAHHHGR
jgi:hypothetical protein